MFEDRRSFISGRKGKTSVADCLIHALLPNPPSGALIPSKSISDLRTLCLVGVGFDVEASTIRSTLYRHPEIFQRDAQKTDVQYKLCNEFLKKIYEE